MRWVVTLTLLVGGFALGAVAYFLLGARLGVPSSPAFSNPRVHYAPLVFIAGVVFVFLAAVVYELLPDRGDGEEEERGIDERSTWRSTWR